MFEGSISGETAIEALECGGAPAGIGMRTRSARLGRARTRMTLAGAALFSLLGDAALTGNFTPVLVAAFTIPRRSAGGARL